MLRLFHAREASKSSVAVHVCERRCLLCIATSTTPTIDALYTLNVVGAALDLHPRVLDKHRERERGGTHRYEEWRMGCRQQPAYSYPLNTHKQIKTLSLSHTHTCAHTHTHTHTHAHAQEAHARTHTHSHVCYTDVYTDLIYDGLPAVATSRCGESEASVLQEDMESSLVELEHHREHVCMLGLLRYSPGNLPRRTTNG